MASRSYAWTFQLQDVVSTDDTVTVPTPGFDNPDKYDTEGADVVVGNSVLHEGEFELAWNPEFSEVEVTNLADFDWQPSTALAVTVGLKPASGEGGGGGDDSAAIAALDTRVAALETSSADTETRLAALEAKDTDLEARVAALEAAAPPADDARRAPQPTSKKPTSAR